MAHQSGTDRHQVFFFSLDAQIGADHPVRAIDAFVDSLDLSALGKEIHQHIDHAEARRSKYEEL